ARNDPVAKTTRDNKWVRTNRKSTPVYIEGRRLSSQRIDHGYVRAPAGNGHTQHFVRLRNPAIGTGPGVYTQSRENRTIGMHHSLRKSALGLIGPKIARPQPRGVQTHGGTKGFHYVGRISTTSRTFEFL